MAQAPTMTTIEKLMQEEVEFWTRRATESEAKLFAAIDELVALEQTMSVTTVSSESSASCTPDAVPLPKQ